MNKMGFFMDAALQSPTPVSQVRRKLLIALTSVTAATVMGAFPRILLASQSDSSTTQRKVSQHINELRRRGLLEADEKTSWSVYDFTTRQKLVAINEDEPLQAASMIKPFVIQAFFYEVSESKTTLRYTQKVRRIMELMIRRSSNWATNYLIRLVSRNSWDTGPSDVEKILKSKAPSIFQQTRIVEMIPPGGKTYKNKASAHDYSRFLYAIWNDRLPYSKEVKALMALPNRDRIYRGVEGIPKGTVVYDKTGSTARLCGNMGILEVPGRDGKTYPYTFIGIIDKAHRARSYSQWVAARGRVIREISSIVYADMKARHNLV